MSKVQVQAPTSSNNSATSSENSETQSIEDPQTILPASSRSAALIRAKSSWKRMKELAAEKENESKRPPWRAVSVSTLPKPDKNALLRAKLLDASRRLRAGKANVGVQTDFVPTKLMKEASIDVQYDLILYKDVGILTDGQYSIRKDGFEQYVLNYSISQMTDSIDTADVSTQTLLPKAVNDNASACPFDYIHYGIEGSYDIEKNTENEKHISKRKISPTLASWHFDDDFIEMETKKHFIPYTIEALKPWRSFISLAFQLRGKNVVGSQIINWYALLQSIDDLVRESNNLIDRIENIIQDKNLHRLNVLKTLKEIKQRDFTTFVFPSEHWLPIIEEQEIQLQKLLDTNMT